VDDNPDAAGTLAGLLILSGHHARFFLDGPTALAAAVTFRPHVCLLDLRMPGMDGCDLAVRLRQALGDETKFIAVTGEHWHQAEHRHGAGEFAVWFRKPADPMALLAALEQLSPAEPELAGRSTSHNPALS
jgi:CheY-like chemotaxis protein